MESVNHLGKYRRSSLTMVRGIMYRSFEFVYLNIEKMTRSFGIATGYGRAAGVRFPAGAIDFSLLHSVQTGSRVQPAS
jgi:hypothetical protein